MRLAVIFLGAFAPFAAFAAVNPDRAIEATCRNSYNLRVLFHDSIAVEAKDGVVTLTGEVPDSDLRPLAVDTVSALPGVTGVNNQITVAPAPAMRTDEAIAMKIRTLLLVKSEVNMAQTTVAVKNGIVTLTGQIASSARKRLVSAYVREIDGIAGVDNELDVRTPSPDRRVTESVDDASITAQVRFTLLTNRLTADLSTSVESRRGVVTLQGGRGTEDQKACAVRLVSAVRGVIQVNDQIEEM